VQVFAQVLKHPDMRIQESDEECGSDKVEDKAKASDVCSGSLECCPDALI
jgi:hypothetical protein